MTTPDALLDRALLAQRLHVAYPAETVERLVEDIAALVERHGRAMPPRARAWLDQSDVMLITYGNSLLDGRRAPLKVLADFLERYVGAQIPDVHLLPFYPYSSDDGFSVIDYRAVNPDLGTWADIARLAEAHELMFDGVINHASRDSAWFKAFCAGDPDFGAYFIVCDPDADYSAVTRPRALPLLTPVDTATGPKHVWTTFSDDQIDLNYENPRVLLEILDLLLFYARRGARFIRLDAIGFLWKALGTTSMHLPQTHALVRVMRQVVDAAAPGTLLITETNVPHKDNVSYFGNGADEAHLVYQFPLPPLTVHAFQTGDASKLSRWAASLEPTSPTTTFFNFMASHDGIGVRPVEGILSPEEVAAMAERVRETGGVASMRSLPDGSVAPYELNVSFIDALSAPQDDDDRRARKFIASQTLLLSLVGVPGIYIHSLLGSRNDLDGLTRTGHNRAINRARLDLATVEAELADDRSLRHRVFHELMARIGQRRRRAAFHPRAEQRVLTLDRRVCALVRSCETDRVLVLINVSDETATLTVPLDTLGFAPDAGLRDLISDTAVATDGSAVTVTLAPYQAMWIAS